MKKQGRNLKNSQITRNHIRFCAQSGRIHGTGVPLTIRGDFLCDFFENRDDFSGSVIGSVFFLKEVIYEKKSSRVVELIFDADFKSTFRIFVLFRKSRKIDFYVKIGPN